ncbi:MAG: hypothetical protein KJ726_02445, partial [Verrucomicrobia bacterium]|nr:hypothetical protein [Verrucomicrobiota bacterium]
MAAGIILCQALRVSEAGAQAQAQKEWPDDEPLVSFSTNLLTIREYDNAIEFGVHLSRAANATVAVSVAGTARHGETNDYVLSTTNLVFSENGPATQLLTLRPIQDTQREGSEYAVLGFGTLAGARPAGGANIHVIIRDDDALTIMAANLTGMEQMYREPSVRIFRGLLPDIVAIQEFKVADNNHRAFVDRAFGTNFYYMVEHSFRKVKFSIPNGIISRWPIIASGEWDDLSSWTRDFAWAIIDIPGSRNLHVVSVHFQYSGGDADRIREARDLVAYVRECVHPDDFLVIAGDLNTHGRNTEVLAILSAIVTDAHQPADQAGDLDTNHTRTGDLDYVLPSANLDALHIPLTLDNITFADGMVFDSTLWPVPPYPIEPNDSHERDMQHMAVMKAFALPQEVNVRVHSWAMEDRGDGDGLVEEGEPHRLSLVVENESGLCISNLALSITSESPDVILGQDYPRRLGDWPAHYAGPVPTCALAITSHVARVDQALRLQWTSDNGSWTSHIPFSVTVQRLPEALDNRDLAFRNGGDAIWAYQTRNAWDGEDAAQCQPLPASGQAYIETTVEGPGRVAFCWQLASPYHSDYMFFTMDQVFRTGNYHCAWTDVSQLVPPGNHVLRWTLFHHNSDPGGTGRLDHVRFAPFTNAVLQTS